MSIFRRSKKTDTQMKTKTNERELGKSEDDEAALSTSLSDTLSILRTRIGLSSDFIIRELGDKIAISYIEGLVEQKQLSELMEALIAGQAQFSSFTHDPAEHLKSIIPIGGIHAANTVGSLLTAILSGEAVVVIDGLPGAITISISGGIRRSVQEPSSQTVVRGPKEGFTEEISTNIALLKLVFFPLVKEKRRFRSPVIISYILVSLFLIVFNQMNFLVLGSYIADKSTIPLLQVIQLIEIIDVFERMDVVFVLILFMGIGIKMAAFFVGAVTGLQMLLPFYRPIIRITSG